MTENWQLDYHRWDLVPDTRNHLAALFLLLLSLPACGIDFRSEFDGTEVFREFALDSDSMLGGEFITGSPIEVTLTVNQAYPVPIAISCRYEDVDITDDERQVAFNERALAVFETVLEANPGHHPRETEIDVRVTEFAFVVREPGDYFVACFTVAAPENGIGRGFTVIE